MYIHVGHRSILLFSRAVAIAVSPLLFSQLGLLGCPLLFQLLAAIFIAVQFSLLPSILSRFSQTAIIVAFHSRPDLLLGCHFCSGLVVAIFILLLKTLSGFFFFFFFFVLFQLSYFSSFSRRHFLVAVPIVTFQPIAIHIL